MTSNHQRWIQVAKQVIEPPFSKVFCPCCNHGFLSITIVPWPTDAPKVDVHLYCEACGAKNTITKNCNQHNND